MMPRPQETPARDEQFNTRAGTIIWRGEGSIPHCEDGPAIIFPNGDKEWWVNGELHREDGPAVLRVNGSNEWWLHGKPWKEGPEDAPENLMRKAREKALQELKKHRQPRL